MATSSVQTDPVNVQSMLLQCEERQKDQTLTFNIIRHLGTAVMVLGSIVLICGIAEVVRSEDPSAVRLWVPRLGGGIWSGTWLLVTGVVGYFAGKTRRPVLLSINLAFSIVSTITCLAVIVPFSIGVVLSRTYLRNADGPCYRYLGSSGLYKLDTDCVDRRNKDARIYISMYSIMLICIVADLVISILASVMISRVLRCGCCVRQPQGGYLVYYPGQNGHTLVPIDGSAALENQPVIMYPVQNYAVHPSQGANSNAMGITASEMLPNQVPSNIESGGAVFQPPPTYEEKECLQ